MQNSKHSNPCAAGNLGFNRGGGGGGGGDFLSTTNRPTSLVPGLARQLYK